MKVSKIMAARKNRGVNSLPDEWKERIKAGVIMDRLIKHVNAEVEMTATQVNAAKILLSKIVPDLARTELNAELNGNLTVNIIKHADSNAAE